MRSRRKGHVYPTGGGRGRPGGDAGPEAVGAALRHLRARLPERRAAARRRRRQAAPAAVQGAVAAGQPARRGRLPRRDPRRAVGRGHLRRLRQRPQLLHQPDPPRAARQRGEPALHPHPSQARLSLPGHGGDGAPAPRRQRDAGPRGLRAGGRAGGAGGRWRAGDPGARAAPLARRAAGARGAAADRRAHPSVSMAGRPRPRPAARGRPRAGRRRSPNTAPAARRRPARPRRGDHRGRRRRPRHRARRPDGGDAPDLSPGDLPPRDGGRGALRPRRRHRLQRAMGRRPVRPVPRIGERRRRAPGRPRRAPRGAPLGRDARALRPRGAGRSWPRSPRPAVLPAS